MSADLDTLLQDAAGTPPEVPDLGALWASGRRRRRLRLLATGASSVAALTAVALVAGTLIQGPGTVTPIDPATPSSTEDAVGDAVERDALDDAPDVVPIPPIDGDEVPAPASEAEVDEPEVEADPVPVDDVIAQERPSEPEQGSVGAEPEASGSAAPAPPAQAGPTPDVSRLADPCAGQDVSVDRAFVAVVGPVEGQVVDGTVSLVGCASVYEGTVSYRVLADGGVLAQGFTTASAGGPELGEFRDTIAVSGSGAATLEVFWEDAADGSERGVVRVPFVRR